MPTMTRGRPASRRATRVSTGSLRLLAADSDLRITTFSGSLGFGEVEPKNGRPVKRASAFRLASVAGFGEKEAQRKHPRADPGQLRRW
jgi:hypothetical protein